MFKHALLDTGMQHTGRLTAADCPSSERRGRRLAFANQLRGLAASAVVVSHLLGVFWADRGLVAAATASPAQPRGAPPWAALLAQPWFNPGPFGVAIFFLISGLVIPISLGAHSRPGFLLSRAFRIYPTYLAALAALAVNLGVVWAGSRFWGLPFEAKPRLLAANALLIQDVLGWESIDLVSWTLCVELKFYLLMALLAPAVRRGGVAPLFAVAAVVLAFNLASHSPLFTPTGKTRHGLIGFMSREGFYVVFMLTGVLFNYRLRGLLRLPAFLAGTAGLFLIFVVC